MLKYNNTYRIILLLLVSIIIIPSYITVKIGSFPGLNLERLIELYLLFIFIVFYLNSAPFRINFQTYIKEYKLLFLYLFSIYFIQANSSLLFGIDQISSFANSIIKFFNQLFLLLIVIAYIDKEKVYKLIKFILILQFIVLILAIIEYFKGGTLFGFLTFLNESAAERLVNGDFRDGRYRLISTMPHSLVLAQFLLILLPFNHFFLSNSKFKTIPFFNITLTPFIIFATDSRMGLALYLLFYILFFGHILWKYLVSKKIYNFSKKIFFNISILMLVVGSVYLVSNFQSILKDSTNYILSQHNATKNETDSSMARIVQINLALKNQSLLGFGSKGQVDILKQSSLKAMDNYYVSLFLNVGGIGLLLFILTIIYIFRLIIKNLNSKIFIPFLFFYLNYCVYVLILSIDHLMSLFFIFLGFLLVLAKNEGNQK